MIVPKPAALLAGQVLAHAIELVSTLEDDEAMTPLGGLLRDGDVELTPLLSEEVSEDLVGHARRMLQSKANLEAWVLTYDNRLHGRTGVVDAIVFEIWSARAASPVIFGQSYQPKNTGTFRLLGEPMLLSKGTKSDRAALAEALSSIREGVDLHPVAGPLWDTWFEADA